MTYTIVARDPDTGHFGVASQTFNLAVGSWVTWAEGGVGAVATQARAERTYGTSGLDLMRGGKTSQQALTALLAIDPDAAVRQVGMVDKNGNVAVHTGDSCFPEAGMHVGEGFATLANMMLNNTVWDAMAHAYTADDGDFADRLIAALRTAQAEGGDMRGKQTAALLIVDAVPNPIPITHLRVDYDPNPVEKLAQIVKLNRAYMTEYTVSGLAAEGRRDDARAALDDIRDLAPGETYLQYLRALHLAAELDALDEAVGILQTLFNDAPIWRTYLEREAAVDNFGVPGLGNRLLDALDADKD